MSDFYSLFDRPTPAANPPTTTPPTAPGEASSYAAAALRREADDLAHTPEGQRNDALNRAAYRMGRHIGAGNITATLVRDTLANAARTAGLPDHEIDLVLRDRPDSALTQGAHNPRHPAPLAPVPDVTTITTPDLHPDQEDTFWAARPLLTHLHDFARARRVSPWAVLGVTLARIITATPHQVCLPPIVGGKASLNLFIGLVGPSGSGKGAAEAVAAEAFLLGRHVVSHNVGSGEGIAHGYMHRTKGDLVWNDDDHAVLFSVPEIDSLAAQGDRKGATLMPQLRSGWTGEQLGFGYADPTKRILIPAHEYRLCLVAGIQPGRAGCLLDDADGGTPQRFLWMPATDPGAPDTPPDEPRPMSWAGINTGSMASIGGIRMSVCDTAKDTIRASRLARLRGDGHALDGHALLAQLKTAAALAVADSRLTVTDDDWDLAGTIATKSAAVRSQVADGLRARLIESNAARADLEAHRAVHVTEAVADAAIRKACTTILRALRREGDWTARSVLYRAARRHREHFDAAIEKLEETGQIVADNTARDATGHGGNGARYRLPNEDT